MGILSYAMSANYGRFYNDLKEISKTNKKPAWLMFMDAGMCSILYGAGLQDYLNFKFYEKKRKERKTYEKIIKAIQKIRTCQTLTLPSTQHHMERACQKSWKRVRHTMWRSQDTWIRIWRIQRTMRNLLGDGIARGRL